MRRVVSVLSLLYFSGAMEQPARKRS